jgi:hypothetical protein
MAVWAVLRPAVAVGAAVVMLALAGSSGVTGREQSGQRLNSCTAAPAARHTSSAASGSIGHPAGGAPARHWRRGPGWRPLGAAELERAARSSSQRQLSGPHLRSPLGAQAQGAQYRSWHTYPLTFRNVALNRGARRQGRQRRTLVRRDDRWHDGDLRAWRRHLDGWRGYVRSAVSPGLPHLEFVAGDRVRQSA